jgi:hypothetical protein
MDPRDFTKEIQNSNLLFKSNNLPNDLKCNLYADYRATETPLQDFKINPNNCCNN